MTAKKVAFSFVLLLVSAVFGAAQQPTSSPARPAPPPTPHTNLKVGDAAPNFTLPSTIVQDGKRMSSWPSMYSPLPAVERKR